MCNETNFDVCLNVIVRVKVCNVSAGSMEEAINKAFDDQGVQQYLHDRFKDDGPTRSDEPVSIAYSEYAEEIAYALVDVVGDEDFSKSQFFHPGVHDGWVKGSEPPSPRVLITVSGGIADYVADGTVDVEIFDRDDAEDDPDDYGGVPESFRDLAEPIGIPVQGGDVNAKG